MRVIGIVPTKQAVGGLVETLRISGFERQDMIISDMEKSFSERGAEDDISNLKTENDSLTDRTPYTDFLLEYADQGIVVAVEVSKHQMDRVRGIMKENGATHIIEDEIFHFKGKNQQSPDGFTKGMT